MTSTTFEVTVLGVILSSHDADTPVTVQVIARAEQEIRGGRDIVVGMSGFGIPSVIDEDDVLITGPDNSFYNNPADVSVSGSSITLTLPTKTVGQNGQIVDTQIGEGGYEVPVQEGRPV